MMPRHNSQTRRSLCPLACITIRTMGAPRATRTRSLVQVQQEAPRSPHHRLCPTRSMRPELSRSNYTCHATVLSSKTSSDPSALKVSSDDLQVSVADLRLRSRLQAKRRLSEICSAVSFQDSFPRPRTTSIRWRCLSCTVSNSLQTPKWPGWLVVALVPTAGYV